MNPIAFCLFLPIAFVVALPSQYEHHHAHHHQHHEHENHDLSNEFWSHHFGPDFQHAIHLQLEQTDLINTGNVIDKHHEESKEGNKKRSAYIVHKPQVDEQQENRTIENSMRVHLLQPDEIEALEKEMLNYAKGNKMIQSPVVVHLPESEASMPKNSDHETPVVLNLPPVVYHSNVNMLTPHFEDNARNSWSQNRKQNLYESKGQHSYEKIQSHPEKIQSPYDNAKQSYEQVHLPMNNAQASFENIHSSYEQPSHEFQRTPQAEENLVNPASHEIKKSSLEETRQSEEMKHLTYDDGKDAKEGNKAEVL